MTRNSIAAMSAPTEDMQSETFAAWLRCQDGIKYTHIPNETYTPYRKQHARNRKLGVCAGLPDYLIIVQKKYQKFAEDVIIFVEMKRDKTCKASPAQAEWIEALNAVENVQASVAYGLDEAIKIVADQLRNPILPSSLQ